MTQGHGDTCKWSMCKRRTCKGRTLKRLASRAPGLRCKKPQTDDACRHARPARFRPPGLRTLGFALALVATPTPASAGTILERVLARLADGPALTGLFVNTAENSGADGRAPRIDGSILLRVTDRIATQSDAPTITARTRPAIATGAMSTTVLGATNTGAVFTQFRLQADLGPGQADPGIDPDPDPDPDPGSPAPAYGFTDLGSAGVMTGLNAAIDRAASATASATRIRSAPMGMDPQAVMLLANTAANTGDIAGTITIMLAGIDGQIAAPDADLAIGSGHDMLAEGITDLLGRLDTTALGSVNTGMIVSGVNGRVGTVIDDITGGR